ncbi:MAG: peptidoglycan editing factor PgeF [Nitrospinota bacterium]|nr:peptidoglycan editing factor PgeF [Nitrospinota bacterium]
MDISIDPVKISGFEKTFRLLYGFSPRYFKVRGKRNAVLRLGHHKDTSASHDHLNEFLQSVNIKTGEVFLVRQTHSNKLYLLDDPSRTPSQTAEVEADAILTRLPGKAIGVLTADCIPIIAYDPVRQAVAVAHAGRRGTSQRILSKTLTALINEFGCKPENILLGMGPGIGVCCYEVDEPCVQPFREKYANWNQFVRPLSNHKFMLDLFAANQEDSLSVGVWPENIFLAGHCTACENHRFFSYRKEGHTGRMMTVAMLDSSPK